jgi:AraC-like DNA-binding protein
VLCGDAATLFAGNSGNGDIGLGCWIGLITRRIGEIAFAAGFNDLSHFSRAYRRHYGGGPRDTRCAGMIQERLASP